MNDDLARDVVAHIDEWVTDPDQPGVQWKLDIERDPDTQLDNFESYGAIAWVRNNDYGSRRPGWHTAGANAPHARILDRHRDQTLWWWPLIDVWGTEKPYNFDGDFAVAKRLYEDGFYGAMLTRRAKCPWCEHSHEDSQYLGGIDVSVHDDAGYYAEVVTDLAIELEPDEDHYEGPVLP